jgi:hypothetical protein
MRNFLYGLVVLCLTLTASCSKDDNLTGDNSINSVSNRNIGNSGIWFVTLFSEDGRNQTNPFAGFSFEFKSNGQLLATKSSESIIGTWKYVTDSGKLKILIGFPNIGKFDDLTEDWELIQETETIIRLKHVSGGNGGTDILELGRSPGAGSSNGSTTTNPVTPGGSWKVIRYLDKDKNRTSYFTGYGFEFKSGGVITASKGTVTVQGSWKTITDSGKSKMIFSFPIQNKFDELNDDWEIILQSPTSILLKNVSGGNGGISYLDFGK